MQKQCNVSFMMGFVFQVTAFSQYKSKSIPKTNCTRVLFLQMTNANVTKILLFTALAHFSTKENFCLDNIHLSGQGIEMTKGV